MYKIYAINRGDGVIYAFDSSFYAKNPTSVYLEVGESEDKDAHKAYKVQDEQGYFNYAVVDGVLVERDKTADIKEREAQEMDAKYIPSYNASLLGMVNKLIGEQTLTADEKISFSGVYAKWTLGKYAVGDIRNHAGQTWECHQAHDNVIYPDIIPDNLQTWAVFWHPLHGKSKETARPWTKPWAGTTDMYHTGEYMVYTDGRIYECLSDTVYSPDEYVGAWTMK